MSETEDIKLALDFEKSLNEEKESNIKDLQNQIQKLKQDRLETSHENKQLNNQVEQAHSETDLIKKQARMYFNENE